MLGWAGQREVAGGVFNGEGGDGRRGEITED